MALAAHYRFEPRPVAVARGNEKGRVERAIRYVRVSFFAGRSWRDVADLNNQADAWCTEHAAQRPCPENPDMRVGEALAQEQPQLLTLPDNPFDTDERITVSVGKTPYLRYDLNDYSVPHTQVRRSLTVLASTSRVRALDGAAVIADHRRTYGKGEQIEEAAHIAALLAAKQAARHHRGQDRLAHAAPSSAELLQQAAARGTPLAAVTAQLVELLDDYGAGELETALREALASGVPHPNAVRQVLERRREQRDQPSPPLTLTLPDNDRVRDIVVRPPSLAGYDQLADRSAEPSGNHTAQPRDDDTPEPGDDDTSEPNDDNTSESNHDSTL